MAILNGTNVAFNLVPQNSEDHKGEKFSWHDLELTINPHCDGTFVTKISFWTISAEDIDEMIDDLKKIRNELIKGS